MILLIELLVILALLVIGAPWIIRLIRRISGKHGTPDLPACANCRYPARGLESFHCPECGSDLREVGITAPAILRKPSLWNAAGNWTLIIVLIGMISSLFVTEFLPNPVNTHHATNLVSRTDSLGAIQLHVQQRYWDRYSDSSGTTHGRRSSPPPQNIATLDFEHMNDGEPPAQISLTLEARPDAGAPVGSTADLRLLPDTTTLTLPDGSEVTETGFDPAFVERWVREAHYDLNDSDIRAETDELIALIQRLRQGHSNTTLRQLYYSGINSSRTGDTAPVAFVLLAFWGLVWGMGIYLIVRRAGRV